MKKTKALNASPNLVDKIDGVPSSILFLLQENEPSTINPVDCRTPCNPGHIPGDKKASCSVQDYMKTTSFIVQI